MIDRFGRSSNARSQLRSEAIEGEGRFRLRESNRSLKESDLCWNYFSGNPTRKGGSLHPKVVCNVKTTSEGIAFNAFFSLRKVFLERCALFEVVLAGLKNPSLFDTCIQK